MLYVYIVLRYRKIVTELKSNNTIKMNRNKVF